MNSAERFIYFPTYHRGIAKYDGTPIPSNEVIDILGEKGIREIQSFMSDLINLRKRVLGRSREIVYGLFPRVSIFDLEELVVLELRDKQIIANPLKTDEPYKRKTDNSYSINISSLIQPGLTADAFKEQVNKLLDTPSYLIPPPNYRS